MREYASQAAQAAFDLVDRLEAELSRFISNSDIGRINHLAPGDETRVSPLTTMECLVIARHMFELTGGAFDVSIGTGLPSLELDVDTCLRACDALGRANRPRRHRQGLRGRSRRRITRGVGARRFIGARRLQLGARARPAGGSGQLAVDPERPDDPIARAGSPLGAADGAWRVGPAEGRPHRRSPDGRARPGAARRVGRPATTATRPHAGGRRAPDAAGAGRCGRRAHDGLHAPERTRGSRRSAGAARGSKCGCCPTRNRALTNRRTSCTWEGDLEAVSRRDAALEGEHEAM